MLSSPAGSLPRVAFPFIVPLLTIQQNANMKIPPCFVMLVINALNVVIVREHDHVSVSLFMPWLQNHH